MATNLSREEIKCSYLAGERLRAEREGHVWDATKAEQTFDQFLTAERYDALGVTDTATDAGAEVLMKASRKNWDAASPSQRLPWQKLTRAVLTQVREAKKTSTSWRAHGTRTKYNKDGCQCDQCTEANTEYLVELKAQKEAGHPPLIASRRTRSTLRALELRGYTPYIISKEIDCSASALTDVLSGHAPSVRPETEEKIIRFAREKTQPPRQWQQAS